MLKYPFEASFDEISADPEPYVSSVFSCLESDFLVMPRGPGFVEYATFEQGYEALKKATAGFTDLSPNRVLAAAYSDSIAFVVVRSMLGFNPSEWAYITTRRTGVEVKQSFARTLDREIRTHPGGPLRPKSPKEERIRAMILAACELLRQGAPAVESGKLHRLDKVDTRSGGGLQTLAGMGVPYAMLLYERFMGRPFAGHGDSVSELVGDPLESGIEEILSRAGISFRKTKRAERIEGFDQAPDFIVPSELNPQVVLEAKLSEDDGTARDKVTRIQHLAELSAAGQAPGQQRFELVACIGGRGFAVRRQDMRKMLLATRGKVFTLKTLDRLVDCTRLKDFATAIGR